MPKYIIRAQKLVYFTTVVEADNATEALLELTEEERVWKATENNNLATNDEVQILGDPEVKE